MSSRGVLFRSKMSSRGVLFRSQRTEQSTKTRSAKTRGRTKMQFSTAPQATNQQVISLIERLHQNKTKCALTFAGGCFQAINWILQVPNASNTVLSISAPYARECVLEESGLFVNASGHRNVSSNTNYNSTMSSMFCSQECSKDLARVAYRRAVELNYKRELYGNENGSKTDEEAKTARDLIGVGASCAFVSDKKKKGEHRVFVSVHSRFGTKTRKVTMDKESGRKREDEDRIASELVVRAVCEESFRRHDSNREEENENECGDDDDDDNLMMFKEFKNERLTFDGDKYEFLENDAPWFSSKNESNSLLERWLEVSHENQASSSSSSSSSNGSNKSSHDDMPERCVYSMRNGKLETIGCSPANLILSGSFNPIHDGHRSLLEAATKHIENKRKTIRNDDDNNNNNSIRRVIIPAFELSISNADKGQLDTKVVIERANQFKVENKRLVLTRNCPLFSQKAKLLPNTIFIVGYDTFIRLIDPKYYDNDCDRMIRELRAIKDIHGCSFLVCGRSVKPGLGSSTTTTTPSKDAAAVDAIETSFETMNASSIPCGLSDCFERLDGFRNDLSSTQIRSGKMSASAS